MPFSCKQLANHPTLAAKRALQPSSAALYKHPPQRYMRPVPGTDTHSWFIPPSRTTTLAPLEGGPHFPPSTHMPKMEWLRLSFWFQLLLLVGGRRVEGESFGGEYACLSRGSAGAMLILARTLRLWHALALVIMMLTAYAGVASAEELNVAVASTPTRVATSGHSDEFCWSASHSSTALQASTPFSDTDLQAAEAESDNDAPTDAVAYLSVIPTQLVFGPRGEPLLAVQAQLEPAQRWVTTGLPRGPPAPSQACL